MAEPEAARLIPTPTSLGEFLLTPEERAQLERLLAGASAMADALAFCKHLTDRGLGIPMEWERPVLQAALRELPDREDLMLRLAVVLETLEPSGGPDDRLSFERLWRRFAHLDLVNAPDAASRHAARNEAFEVAAGLLSSARFARESVARQTAIIQAIHDTLMSLPSSDLAVVADIGLQRFEHMLDDAELTEPQACLVYDCLHGLYFAGVSDIRDLRRFDRIVSPFEDWLEARHGRRRRPRPTQRPDEPLTIAYLLHTAHFDRGNAVTPLIVTLAEMHATRPGRRILVFAPQHVGPDFEERLTGLGLTVRAFEQGGRYDRIDEVAHALRADGVDIIFTEQNRALGAALFVRRVASCQMWLDTGFPFWSLRALDWGISPSATDGEGLPPRFSRIVWRQRGESLKAQADPAAVARLKAQFPPGGFVLGVFSRLIKLDAAYLSFLGRLLLSDPSFHLVIAGPGDPSAVEAFARRADLAGRVSLHAGMVDLNLYGPAIDLMCDTFPFVGGNACREVAAHGVPTLSKLGTPWDYLLRADRIPELLATTEEEYVAKAIRMARDPSFRSSQKDAALAKAAEYSDPQRMVDDVETAIAAAMGWR